MLRRACSPPSSALPPSRPCSLLLQLSSRCSPSLLASRPRSRIIVRSISSYRAVLLCPVVSCLPLFFPLPAFSCAPLSRFSPCSRPYILRARSRYSQFSPPLLLPPFDLCVLGFTHQVGCLYVYASPVSLSASLSHRSALYNLHPILTLWCVACVRAAVTAARGVFLRVSS